MNALQSEAGFPEHQMPNFEREFDPFDRLRAGKLKASAVAEAMADKTNGTAASLRSLGATDGQVTSSRYQVPGTKLQDSRPLLYPDYQS
jgi:hypothetical protein